MGSPFHERNQRSRDRLERLIATLRSSDFDLEAEGGWTVGALLVHVAFWDRFVRSRWEHAHSIRRVSPVPLGDEMADLINAAAIPVWRAVPGDQIGALSLSAAAEIDDAIELLSDAAFDVIRREGRQGLVDRSMHREEHLAAIERALATRPTLV